MKRWVVGLLLTFLACSLATGVLVAGCFLSQSVGTSPAQNSSAPATSVPPTASARDAQAGPVPTEPPTLPTGATVDSGKGATGSTAALTQPSTDARATTELRAGSETGSTAEPSPTPTPEPSTLEAIRSTYPLPVRDLFSLAQRLGRLGGGARRIINPAPPDYQIGDTESFWVSELTGQSYFEITATLQYVGEHAAWWVQDGEDFDRAGLVAAAKRFDEQTYPTDRRYFGEEWFPGIDNDPRIQIVNGLLADQVGGYYSSADEYPNAINPHSNQREVIYINLKAYNPGDKRYDAVIAHEFQHMIHWHNDANESTWVDEGLAELAVHLNGYGQSQWASVFAREPDTQLNAWADVPGAAGAHYGASYLFMRYFAERFGAERVRSLVAAGKDGVVGFDATLVTDDLTFDDVFRDWVIANYLDDPSLADGRFGYRDMDIPTRLEDTLHAGESWGDTVHQYATDYLAIRPQAGSAIGRFKGGATVPVLATHAHSGDYFLWSNRGDGSVTSATHAFDLSDTEQATLNAWLWYDIEEYFDYVYVEASTDGGATWQILAGQHSTSENPTGNGLGPGYSGHSQSGTNPGWVRESVDLTPYAGQTVLIRWEQLTDDGFNAPGLALDDVSIPEIGYSEDFESGYGGWEASGFARIDNVLPQHWALQLIELDGTPRVQEIPVYDGRATFKVEGRAVLAVSAMTPFTTEPADYSISVD